MEGAGRSWREMVGRCEFVGDVVLGLMGMELGMEGAKTGSWGMEGDVRAQLHFNPAPRVWANYVACALM